MNTCINAFQTQQFKKIGGKDFIIFNGPDEQYLAGRIMGAEAGIGSTYAVMPELYVKMEECYLIGDIKAAQKWQFAINEIITELLSFSSMYGAIKMIIKMRGIDIGNPRMPIEPVREDEYTKLELVYNKILINIDEAV